MCAVYKRSDRTARLLKLEILLSQNPDGMEVAEIARRCSVSLRTIYRDLKTLERELKFPIWEEGAKRGVVKGFFLPPVAFNLTEAMTIYLASRMMQNLSHVYNPSIASAFLKLNSIVPQPLRQQIQNTIQYIEKQPRDERKIHNFNKLSDACLHTHQVKFKYQCLSDDAVKEYTIDPYTIEPSLLDRSNIVIAYCHHKKAVRTFVIDRIIGDVVVLENETYILPSDFNITDYVNSAWNFSVVDKFENIKLRFDSKVSKVIMGTIWHPSQKMEIQEDGSIIMTLGVQNTAYVRHWIMGWGDAVEILEPETLRNHVIQNAQSILKLYNRYNQ